MNQRGWNPNDWPTQERSSFAFQSRRVNSEVRAGGRHRAWAEFEGFSNNLFLGAIEYMDIGDEARELAYESGLLDL